MSNKLYGMLGIARRSRKVVMGDTLIAAIQSGKAKVVLISNEASENTLKKIQDKCAFYHVKFSIVDDMLMNQAIGELNKKAVGVIDDGMAKKIKEYMEE